MAQQIVKIDDIVNGENIELKTNKTLSVNVSSTDEEYPSAKGVYLADNLKVDKVANKSLVLDTEIAKIHASGSDNQVSSDFDIKDLTDSTSLRSSWTGKQDALGFTPENSANKNANNGYAPLDAGGKVPTANLPNTLMKYKSVWNASTNTPTLTDTQPTKAGEVYIVSAAGTQFSINWKLGDWLVYNDAGTIEISQNSDEVVSVAGQTGIVTLAKGDVSLGNVDNTADINKTVAKSNNIVGGNSTTLKGSIPYQNDTDTTLLLAPNTTTTHKFLKQTGDGVNGIAPAWDVLSISDLPNLLNLNLNQVTSAGVLTSTINATSGNLNGSYNYVVTFVTALGETDAKNISTTVSPVNKNVDLTNIPISSDPTVTARKIYRNTAANYTIPTTLLNLVCTISDNTTTTYTDNIADGSLGVSVPRINTTGGNVLIGSQIIATTNQNTTSFGINSLLYNTGYANTSFGTSCLQSNTIGLRNSAFGLYALQYNSTGNLNAAFGVHSLNYNTTGSNNTAFGATALQTNTTASGNTAIGTASLYNNTTGANNTGIGFSSLINNTTGYENVASGINSLYHNTTGYDNTAAGAFSLEAGTTGHNNTAFGFAVLQKTTTASNNAGVGANALTNNTIGSGNVAMGINSMQNSVTPSNNTIIGFFSGQNISQSVIAGSFIVGVSYTILSAGTTDFTLIGAANSTVGTVFTATGVGSGSGTASSNSNGNTAIGYMSGRYIANGSTALTSPTNCTYIGTNSFASADGVTNETAIGYGSIGKGSNTVVIGSTYVTQQYLYGHINLDTTVTAVGTTGNRTINKETGTVNFAAAATAITVTSNLVTTSSIIFAVVRTNDTTATIKNVVPAGGSFVINLTAEATAETSVGFFIIN
jgi:hypothetical protein